MEVICHEKSWDNIQDFLTYNGFTIDHRDECFYKWVDGFRKIIIPFKDLSKYTLKHFQEKGQKEGWYGPLPIQFQDVCIAIDFGKEY